MTEYGFKVEEALGEIERHWREWAKATGAKRWVVGVSGGVDSTVVLSLACRFFGPENVIGVMLPKGVQMDIGDSERIIDHTGATPLLIDIGESTRLILANLHWRNYEVTDAARINLPPRIRLAALYAVAQTVGGMVLNTSNLSEDMLGYATLWGDTCGSYAPIQALTKTEVMAVADAIGVPHDLGHKTPADGLQDKSDEERLGLTYADVDRFIRTGEASADVREKSLRLYRANRFKLEMIRLPGPKFTGWYPNHIKEEGDGE